MPQVNTNYGFMPLQATVETLNQYSFQKALSKAKLWAGKGWHKGVQCGRMRPHERQQSCKTPFLLPFSKGHLGGSGKKGGGKGEAAEIQQKLPL